MYSMCNTFNNDIFQLQTPSDEKLEEFWIDFNVGTESLSFYVSTDDEVVY